MKKIVVVSDIHINGYFSKWYKFLEILPKLKADILILNGDIYDLLVGKPQFNIISEIQAQNKLKEIIYIKGNHDCNLNHYFPELTFHESYELGDLIFLHGEKIKDKPSTIEIFFGKLRDSLEKTFNVNIRLIFKKALFGLMDKYLLKKQLEYVNRYPNKKVILGHTHIPLNKPPLYNSGCMTDDFFSYLVIYLNKDNTTKVELHQE